MNPYRAGDGRWFFLTGLEAARHIAAVCRALGHPELLDDPRFADASAIRGHRRQVIAILDGIVAEHPLEFWAERFDEEGVWWAPARTPAEVVIDPQLLVNDGIAEIDADGTGTVQRSVNGPVSFSDVAVHRYAPVPGLGQHTDEVLRELAERAETPPPARQ
jgi:crotonobetainyl-CoA:carnitine CoA-transferase CaiB-like acyl-CoA transferase